MLVICQKKEQAAVYVCLSFQYLDFFQVPLDCALDVPIAHEPLEPFQYGNLAKKTALPPRRQEDVTMGDAVYDALVPGLADDLTCAVEADVGG